MIFAAGLNSLKVWLGENLVAIVIIAALIAIAVAALNYFQLWGKIPPIVWYILWICVIAFLAIMAINFLLSLG